MIGGDGNKMNLIKAIVNEYNLQDKVQLMGFTFSSDVPELLSCGDIFLNTSISEAFCMAILEAASCGLYVVSTKVGGIHEILPNEYLTLSEPNPQSLISHLSEIIQTKKYLKKKDCN